MVSRPVIHLNIFEIDMKLIHDNIEKLEEIKALFSELSPDLYIQQIPVLNGATLGQHFRHILEFYICLIKGVAKGEVCYDERERNELIESKINYATKTINNVIMYLLSINSDKAIVLKSNYSTLPEDYEEIPSSLHRELAYALDHTVHHLALVKIALQVENIPVDEHFGVAPSTIRYRQLAK